MKRKNILVLTGSALILILLIWYFSKPDESLGSTIEVEAEIGEFVIDVTTTGELDARSSEKIMGPNSMGLRNRK